MRAIILAAGRGSRLGARTAALPKCLVELRGRSLLSRQVSALTKGGVGEIGIVRGYRPETIVVPGATYFENTRWESTNMVMSTAQSWLERGPVIISYSDIFYSAELVQRLITAGGNLVVAYDTDWLKLWSRRFSDPLTDAETFKIDQSGFLLEIGAKTERISEIEGQYIGLLKFTPAAWREATDTLSKLDDPARARLDMTSLLGRLLASGSIISTLATKGNWGEVDNESDLTVYESMLEAGEIVMDN